MALIKIISQYLWSEKKLLPMTILLIMLLSCSAIVSALFIRFMIDFVLPQKDQLWLNYSFAFLIAFILVRTFFGFIQDIAVVVLRQKIEFRYNQNYMESLFNFKMTEFLAHDRGDLINRFNLFLNDIEKFFGEFIFFIFYALFIFLFLSIILFLINKILFFTILAFLPLHFINFKFSSRYLKNANQQFYQQYTAISKLIQQSITGLAALKNCFLYSQTKKEHQKLSLDLNYWFFKKNIFAYLQQLFQSSLIFINYLLVILLGSWQIMRGDCQPGLLIFCLLLMQFFYEPVYRFSRVNELLQSACQKIEAVTEIIENKNRESGFHNSTAPLLPHNQTIRQLDLQNVSYRTPGGKIIFNQISYCFTRGNIYFLKGKSGAGKTTLFQLLLKFKDKNAGQIRLNDFDIDRMHENELRKIIGCAQQESLLFPDTIIRNIHLAEKQDYDARLLQQACYFAVLDELMQDLPDGLYTQLVHLGDNISGGQKQRINLARLFYYNPRVLLLDEPTSGLDIKTETLFLERLQQYKKDKIIIMINHKDNHDHFADEIIYLDRAQLFKQRLDPIRN